MIVKGFDNDCKRVVVFFLLSIVENSGFSSKNLICTLFWEIELCDMGPEPAVCNRVLLCISEDISNKDMKII
jgi:hypothetical protein